MSAKYSMLPPSKTLIFTGRPKLLDRSSVRRKAKKLVEGIIIPNSVASVGKETFSQCSDLSSIHIPNSVLHIDEWAFSYCHALASIKIANSVSAIGMAAFYSCGSLTSAHIPNSVAYIERSAFCYCSALTSIHIPNSISQIRAVSFYSCSTLASIHIPNSVSTVGGLAFCNCPKIHIACLPIHSKISVVKADPSFSHQTVILRPRIKSIISLQKKPACRANKTSYSIHL